MCVPQAPPETLSKRPECSLSGVVSGGVKEEDAEETEGDLTHRTEKNNTNMMFGIAFVR